MDKAEFMQLVRIGAGTTLGGILVLVLLAWLAERAGWIEGTPQELVAQALGATPSDGGGMQQLAAGSGSGCAYES